MRNAESVNKGDFKQWLSNSKFQFPNSEARDQRPKIEYQNSNSQPAIRPPQLKGDIDNIVLKALRREPERRYATVEQFSEDVHRFLRGLPVSARRDTWTYRTEKFVRRNALAVAAAILVALSLIVGIAFANYQAAIARRERARAEQRFGDVRQLANSVLFDLYDAIPETPGSTPVRRKMVERAKNYLDQLSRESEETDPNLQRELATAYLKFGDIQGLPNMANSGDTAAALESYRKAAAILENLVAAAPSNEENRRDLSVALANIGRIQNVSSDYQSALETFRRVLAMREQLAAQHPESIEYRRLISDSRTLVGDALGTNFEMTERKELLAEQLENYRQALDINVQLLTSGGAATDLQRRLIAILYQRIGSVLTNSGEQTGDAGYFR